jgi:hypothetical protein
MRNIKAPILFQELCVLFARLCVELPQLNRNDFAKADEEVQNKMKHKKALHQKQQFLVTAKLPPLLRSNKSFAFLPPE